MNQNHAVYNLVIRKHNKVKQVMSLVTYVDYRYPPCRSTRPVQSMYRPILNVRVIPIKTNPFGNYNFL
jgi:hypothetical protein